MSFSIDPAAHHQSASNRASSEAASTDTASMIFRKCPNSSFSRRASGEEELSVHVRRISSSVASVMPWLPVLPLRDIPNNPSSVCNSSFVARKPIAKEPFDSSRLKLATEADFKTTLSWRVNASLIVSRIFSHFFCPQLPVRRRSANNLSEKRLRR